MARNNNNKKKKQQRHACMRCWRTDRHAQMDLLANG